jgi:hypothetical protein
MYSASAATQMVLTRRPMALYQGLHLCPNPNRNRNRDRRLHQRQRLTVAGYRRPRQRTRMSYNSQNETACYLNFADTQ